MTKNLNRIDLVVENGNTMCELKATKFKTKMKGTLSLLALIIVVLGCKSPEGPSITIVDIGKNNRIELGRQLRIINKYSPKLIVLDFFLDNDSLSVDSILVKELAKSAPTVQATAVHNFDEQLNSWDSLEVSHSKFKVTYKGYSNITVDDSIFIPRLPMRQLFRDDTVLSLSYLAAKNTYGVKKKYAESGTKDVPLLVERYRRRIKIIARESLSAGKFKEMDIRGKIVVMGYVGKLEDNFYLDKERSRRISGAEIQACIIQQVMDAE